MVRTRSRTHKSHVRRHEQMQWCAQKKRNFSFCFVFFNDVESSADTDNRTTAKKFKWDVEVFLFFTLYLALGEQSHPMWRKQFCNSTNKTTNTPTHSLSHTRTPNTNRAKWKTFQAKNKLCDFMHVKTHHWNSDSPNGAANRTKLKFVLFSFYFSFASVSIVWRIHWQTHTSTHAHEHMRNKRWMEWRDLKGTVSD